MRIKTLSLALSMHITLALAILCYTHQIIRELTVLHENKQLLAAAFASEAILGNTFHDKRIQNNLENNPSDESVNEKLSLYAKKCGLLKIYTAVKLEDIIFITASSQLGISGKRQILGRFIQSFTHPEKILYQSFKVKFPVYFSYHVGKYKVSGVYLPRVSSDGHLYVICCELYATVASPFSNIYNIDLNSVRMNAVWLVFFIGIPLWCTIICFNDGKGIFSSRTSEKDNYVNDSNLLAIMSHEIKNPINNILSINHLFKDTQLTRTQKEYTELIDTSSRNLLKIIDNVLTFSKIEHSDSELNIMEFDIVDFLDDVIYSAFLQLGDKKILMGYNISQNVPRKICTDQGRLSQVIMNLLTNAVKYTKEGYINLSVSYKYIDEEHILTVDINDTGIGIEKEKQHAIFDLFYQVNDSIPDKAKGVGLGLAICKKLIAAMGGSIWVTSTFGKGSTFSFFIRLKETVLQSCTAKIFDYSIFQAFLHVKNPFLLYHLKSHLTYLHISFHEMLHASSVSFKDMGMPAIVITDCSKTFGQLRVKLSMSRSRVVYLPSDCKVDKNEEHFLSPPIRIRKLNELFSNYVSFLNKNNASNDKNISTNFFQKKNRLSILYADDSGINRKVMSHMLRKLGYEADGVEDGEAAVNACRMRRYDLIFMDLKMPRLDGIEASRILKKLHGENAPVIIALTANAAESHKELCMRAGMNDFLTKPIELECLREKILKYASHDASSVF